MAHKIIAKGSIGKIVYPSLFTGSRLLVSKIAIEADVIDEYKFGRHVINEIEEKEDGYGDCETFLVDKKVYRRYRFGVYGLNYEPLLAYSTRMQKRRWDNLIEKSPDLCNIDPMASYLMHMEKADGDVHSLLEQCTPKTLFAALLALRNVAIGLTKLHDAQIYHFDVKPSNILFFGSLKNPETMKIGDFGLAHKIDDGDIWNAASLQFPWHNFPPWASYIALFYQGGSQYELAQKEHDIRIFFEKPESERFSCVDEELYMRMQIDIAPFLQDPALLFCAVDIYGLALCLHRIYWLAPLRVRSHIEQFCSDAAMCALRDDDILDRWDDMLRAF